MRSTTSRTFAHEPAARCDQKARRLASSTSHREHTRAVASTLPTCKDQVVCRLADLQSVQARQCAVFARAGAAAGRHGVTSNCLHPGVVATGFGRSDRGIWGLVTRLAAPFAFTGKGAATTIYLALSPEVETVSGKYFADCKVARPAPRSARLDGGQPAVASQREPFRSCQRLLTATSGGIDCALTALISQGILRLRRSGTPSPDNSKPTAKLICHLA